MNKLNKMNKLFNINNNKIYFLRKTHLQVKSNRNILIVKKVYRNKVERPSRQDNIFIRRIIDKKRNKE
jgi:hypothetical protein